MRPSVSSIEIETNRSALLKNCRDAVGHTYGAQENYEADIASGLRLGLWRLTLSITALLSLFGVLLSWIGLCLYFVAFVIYLIALPIHAHFSKSARSQERWDRVKEIFSEIGEEDLASHARVESDSVQSPSDQDSSEGFEGLKEASFPVGRDGTVTQDDLSGMKFLLVLPKSAGWADYIISIGAWTPVLLPLTSALRAIGFQRYRKVLLPFIASRCIFTGAGTVRSNGRFELSEKAGCIRKTTRLTLSEHTHPVFDAGTSSSKSWA